MRFLINSADRQAGSASSSDFTVALPTPLRWVQSISLNSLYLPNTVYNVDSSNNVIAFRIGVTIYTATLSPGNYHPHDSDHRDTKPQWMQPPPGPA